MPNDVQSASKQLPSGFVEVRDESGALLFLLNPQSREVIMKTKSHGKWMVRRANLTAHLSRAA
jgi:hypothetical protein